MLAVLLINVVFVCYILQMIGYSTHVAANFIMRGIKKVHRKVRFIIFTKIFYNLTTIHKHIDHIWLKFLTSSLSYGNV